jgi:hypothetical protein
VKIAKHSDWTLFIVLNDILLELKDFWGQIFIRCIPYSI